MPSRSQWKLWRSLRRRKGRAEHGRFLVEGPNLVAELLATGLRIEHLLYTPAVRAGRESAALLERCAEAGVPVVEVEEGELAELAATVTPQGMLAVAGIPRRGWSEARGGRILLLDGVQDPGNLGTLVRTAEAVGVDAVVCLPGTVDPWNPKAVRAAAGSGFRVPILESGWEEARRQVRSRGAAIWVADPHGAPFFRWEAAPSRLALVLGNEARGVSEEVRAAADRRVSVPMAGRVESLNVAVAGAILMDRVFGGGEEGSGSG